MPGLRQSVLETIRMLGNRSGCHQMPERSFFYKGKQFPVCARCTGVIIGQSVALLIGMFKDISFRKTFLCLAIMGVDWGLQEIRIKESTNFRRLITGVLGGFGFYSILVGILKKCIYINSKNMKRS